MPPEFRALLERFNQLGCLLPKQDDLDLEDQKERANVDMILTEMSRVKAQIDAYLAAEWKRRRAS
jgi:hypothetical protein